MLQAAVLDCVFFDFFPFSENSFIASEVDVRRRDVAEALVVALVVVVFHKRTDLVFEISGQVVVFEKNTVLHGLVPPLNLSLSLRVMGRTAHMCHIPLVQPFGQIA